MVHSNKSTFAVFSSMLKMAVATLCSRLLGLVREQVMAMYFGASGLTDAFLVAYRIPNMLRDLFAEGAFSAAFVPTFVKSKMESEESAKKLLWNLFYLLSLITLGLGGLTYIYANEIVSLVAPEFVNDPEKLLITVNLTKWMSPFLFFVSIAALFMGALNSLKIFFLPSLAPAFFNATMIIIMIFGSQYLSSQGSNPIYSLGVGVLIGGIVQAFVQFPLLLKAGYKFELPRNLINSHTKEVFKKLGPGLIGFAATQINLIVNTILATSTVVGAVSWLSYAFRLFQFPVGILSVSIGNSNLVHFSESYKAGEIESAKKHLSDSFFLSFLLIIPVMAVIFLNNNLIVSLVFQRGKFLELDTLNTSILLVIYTCGLPFYGLYKIFVPTLYAIDRQMVPVIASIVSIAFNVIFSLLLVKKYSFPVLAAGTSISIFINVLILSFSLKKYLELPFNFFFNLRIFKIIGGGALAFLAMSYIQDYIYLGDLFFQKSFSLVISSVGVLIIFTTSIYILGEREAVNSIAQKIMSKFSR